MLLLLLYLLHDVFDFILFTVQDHPPLLLVLQILEQRAVGLILPLVFQVPHIDGGHLPLPLCCCVQNNLQCRQTWKKKQFGEIGLIHSSDDKWLWPHSIKLNHKGEVILTEVRATIYKVYIIIFFRAVFLLRAIRGFTYWMTYVKRSSRWVIDAREPVQHVGVKWVKKYT